MSGLEGLAWVDVNDEYNLTCIVEQAKPKVRVHWLIHETLEEAVNKVEDEDDGLKKTTGTLANYKFQMSPARQKVSCVITSWDNKTDVKDEREYNTFDVYCK